MRSPAISWHLHKTLRFRVVPPATVFLLAMQNNLDTPVLVTKIIEVIYRLLALTGILHQYIGTSQLSAF